jgi:hypothetical protein
LDRHHGVTTCFVVTILVSLVRGAAEELHGLVYGLTGIET